MKKIALAAAMSVAASVAFAGNVAEPVVDVVEVVEDSSSSSSGALLPILALLVVGAAIAAND
ncbi:MAG: hypothetical protein QNK92_02665 [Amylibacter sp.]